MTQTEDIEFILSRAAWELRQARPYLAYRLYLDAAERVTGAERRRQLNAALEICLEYFSEDADETIQVATGLCELTDRRDSRALVAGGTARSLRARHAWTNKKYDEAWQLALEAERDLRDATARTPFDTDAWGTLGGLYKRMAQWAKQRKNDAMAETYRTAMLQAYAVGMKQGPDAYPLLNFLEYRAVIGKTLPIVRDAAEKAQLERALYVRKRQFARGEDAPWAAFDIARGQHYARTSVPRFLSDLQVAIDDARRVARRASDRWMVDSAVTSLRDLHEAGVLLDGLEEALLLTQRAVVDDDWFAGNWGPLGRPEDFLVSELRAARADIDALASRNQAAQELLLRHVARTEERWSEQDEERFAEELDNKTRKLNEEVAQFKQDIEPPVKKQLRVLWKLFGENALEWAFTATATAIAPVLLPGAAVVSKYVTHLIDQKAAPDGGSE
jgi:hypothetical protein